MKKLSILFTALIAVVLFTNIAFGQSKDKPLKIGVVDVEKIVKEMPEAIEADKILKDLQKVYSDTLKQMETNLMQRAENYQKQRGMMTADQQKAEETSLKEGEQAYYQFRQAKFAEIEEKSELYLAPIRKKVNDAIDTVAKDQGLSFVFDKNKGALLFADDKYDITFKVIDKIKTGK